MKAKKPEYSKEFKEYHSMLFDFKEFIEWMQKPLRKSIRVNSIKIDSKRLFEKLGWGHEKIPWARDGFWVDMKYGTGATTEHAIGYYYVQEASSMMPVEALNIKNGDMVLDMCAAPGSKTTQIGAINLGGTIIANDSNTGRVKSLISNLTRMGIANCIVTKNDGQKLCKIKKFKEKFDRVLVDAPCSEVGTARKNTDSLRVWTPSYVKRISALQKKLICSGFECLKKGGVMVYSTCTTSIEENEDVVRFLLDRYENAGTGRINLNARYESAGSGAARVYPWHNDTECAFIAKITKR